MSLNVRVPLIVLDENGPVSWKNRYVLHTNASQIVSVLAVLPVTLMLVQAGSSVQQVVIVILERAAIPVRVDVALQQTSVIQIFNVPVVLSVTINTFVRRGAVVMKSVVPGSNV